ncbi:MAG: hypothetical protein IT463_09000 [Planctomycetes bacterium]|nr:hypothetical protein [Planctomycetota bacterium]
MKGYAQVERAEVDVGLVVLSSKNILRSSDLLPVGELNGRKGIRFWKPAALKRMFENTFDGLTSDVNRLIGAVERPSQATLSKAVPFVFWMGTTATLARVDNLPRPTLHSLSGGWRVALPDGPANDNETRQVLDSIHRELAR